jgi:molybdenum cofactor biosynthesis enzyme MoaA
MSKSCMHTKNHLAIVASNKRIAPCCQYQPQPDQDHMLSLDDVSTLNGLLETDRWINLRSDLEAGKQIKQCQICWTNEHNSPNSKRIWSNGLFKDADVKVGKLQDLEIGLDYTCNMMCRICKPEQSSKWNAAKPVVNKLQELVPDQYLYGDTKYKDKLRTVLDNTDLSNLENLRIVGGEPFYSKNFSWFMDKLYTETNLRKLRFAVSTNGSIIPDEKILTYFAEMKNVSIDLSIDAVGDLAEVTRHGVSWDIIYANICEWVNLSKEFDNMGISIHSTVSILNVNKMQDIVDMCDDLGIWLTASRLTNPQHLHPYQIPKYIREGWKVRSKTNSWLETNSVIDSVNKVIAGDSKYEVSNRHNKFIKIMGILDGYHNNSFTKVNPEIYNIVQSLTE